MQKNRAHQSLVGYSTGGLLVDKLDSCLTDNDIYIYISKVEIKILWHKNHRPNMKQEKKKKKRRFQCVNREINLFPPLPTATD